MITWWHGPGRCLVVAMVAVGLAIGGLATTAPVVVGDTGAAACCRVRNVTQGTQGSAFRPMLRAAVDGDRLRVWGTCVGGGAVTVDLRIRGMGERPTLTGLGERRVLRVVAGATVLVRDLRLVDGDGRYAGGVGGGAGIHNAGTMRLTDVVVRDGVTGEYVGGLIANTGTLTLVRTTVRGGVADWGGGIGNRGVLVLLESVVARSRAFSEGGGIWDRGNGLTVRDSAVVGNGASSGGGLFVGGRATVRIERSTVADNRAGSRGGGILKEGGGTLELRETTVSGNRAGGAGGGLWTRYGSLVLEDSGVVGNTAGEPGGGLYVSDGSTTVTIGEGTFIRDNEPDDCAGTDAC